MYVVKDEATRRVWSWHQESKQGLRTAIAEADMRSEDTNRVYLVTDNHNLRLYRAVPAEVKFQREQPRRAARQLKRKALVWKLLRWVGTLTQWLGLLLIFIGVAAHALGVVY